MRFVDAYRATYGVGPLLSAIGEPPSTFYQRVSRPASARSITDAALLERIEAIWERSRRTYGAPRIHAMLARDGIHVGRKRVERLMRSAGIAGVHLRKHWRTTTADPDHQPAPDLVDRRPRKNIGTKPRAVHNEVVHARVNVAGTKTHHKRIDRINQ